MSEVLQGFLNVFDLQNLMFIIFGVIIGTFIGAMPGLSVTLAVALMLPFTFSLPPDAGILFLIAIYCSGIFGGSITAVLLKTPGTAASAATAEDGFALAQRGKANEALQMSLYASVIAGIISGLALLFVAPQLATVALKFGPPEYFSLAVFGMTIIAGVSGKYLSKGISMAALGILFSSIGLDSIEGTTRLTFGSIHLLSGISLIPALIGVFAVAEILRQSEQKKHSISSGHKINKKKFGFKDLIPFRKTILKSSLIGVIVGSIPGTGSGISSFISYNEARRTSKKPEEFGKGSLDGVAAAEAGNNGVTGATLIPMMTLGIPGDVTTAVLLGALLIQGLNPGPQLFVDHGTLVYTVMIGFIVANIIMFIFGKLTLQYFAKVTLVPLYTLFPIVLAVSLLGSFAFTNSLFTVWTTLFFGALGYFFIKFGYPMPPFIIGFILGPIAEVGLRQSMVLSKGSLFIFLERPISLLFILLAVASGLLPVIIRHFKEKRKFDKA